MGTDKMYLESMQHVSLYTKYEFSFKISLTFMYRARRPGNPMKRKSKLFLDMTKRMKKVLMKSQKK